MAAGGPMKELCEEATCSICLDFFRDPVILMECGHNFCRDCLARSWGEAEAEASCPQCRGRAQEGNLRPNQQLANFVEIIKKLTSSEGKEGGCEKIFSKQDEVPFCMFCGSSQGHKDQEEAAGEMAVGAVGKGRVCQKHQEPMKLFCKDDEALICVVCDRSKEHREHEILPLEEASQEYKKASSPFTIPIMQHGGDEPVPPDRETHRDAGKQTGEDLEAAAAAAAEATALAEWFQRVTVRCKERIRESWSCNLMLPLPLVALEQAEAIHLLQKQMTILYQCFGAGVAGVKDQFTREEEREHAAWVRRSFEEVTDQLRVLGLPTYEEVLPPHLRPRMEAVATKEPPVAGAAPAGEGADQAAAAAVPRGAVGAAAGQERIPPRESLLEGAHRPDLKATFDGDAKNLAHFLHQVRVYMEEYGDTFPSERAKVLFVLERLSEGAVRWAVAVCNDHDPCMASVDAFMLALHRQFEDVRMGRRAWDEIMKVRQGNRNVYEYTREFRQHAIYLHHLPEDILVQYYRDGLNPALQREITLRVWGENLEDWITVALDTEERIASLPKRDPKGAIPGRAGKPRVGATTPAGEQASGEMEHRRSRNLCLRCGKAGHFVATCPQPPPAKSKAGTPPERTSAPCKATPKKPPAKKTGLRRVEAHEARILSSTPVTSSEESSGTSAVPFFYAFQLPAEMRFGSWALVSWEGGSRDDD